MATNIETLKHDYGDIILPRTVTTAISDSEGNLLDNKIRNGIFGGDGTIGTPVLVNADRLDGQDGNYYAKQSDLDLTDIEIVNTNVLVDEIKSSLIVVDSQLAEKAKDITENKRALSYFWFPETQPSARTDNEGYFVNAFAGTSDSYITSNFEPLRLANPDYVTRVNLGKDESGLYDVWRYSFTPKDYKKTIVLSSCMHGTEVTLMVAMLRFLDALLNDSEKYPDIAYIRNNVRIIYIPFVNPWGVNQTPRTRYNSNGVDINRNFGYRWSDYVSADPDFGHDFKGVSAFSEVESRYIRDTMIEYKNAIAYFDFHNTGGSSTNLYVSLPTPYAYTSTFNKLVEHFSKTLVNPVINLEQASKPMAAEYVYYTYGIPSAHPEWCDTTFGAQQYDSTEITWALAWISNVIIQHCKDFGNEDTFVIENYYSRTGTNLNIASGSTPTEITEFRFELDSPFDGLVLMEGAVILAPTDLAGLNYISPVVSQVGSDFSNFLSSAARDEVYSTGLSRLNIPFQTQTTIKKADGVVGKIQVGLSGSTTSGTATVYRYRCRLTFIPTKDVKRYSIYTANGREGAGVGAMQIVYPV